MEKPGITARILSVLRAQRQQKQTQIRAKQQKIWTKLGDHIEKIASCRLQSLHSIHTMVILLVIFLLILHPGIGIRPIPPFSNFPSNRNVRSPIGFCASDNSLQIYRNNGILGVYPATIQTKLAGVFRIIGIEKYRNKWLVYLESIENRANKVLLGTDIPPSLSHDYIIFENDIWDMVYPYIRLGMLLNIKGN